MLYTEYFSTPISSRHLATIRTLRRRRRRVGHFVMIGMPLMAGGERGVGETRRLRVLLSSPLRTFFSALLFFFGGTRQCTVGHPSHCSGRKGTKAIERKKGGETTPPTHPQSPTKRFSPGKERGEADKSIAVGSLTGPSSPSFDFPPPLWGPSPSFRVSRAATPLGGPQKRRLWAGQSAPC